MEPTTLIAEAIVNLLLEAAFKKGGKILGKGVSEQFSRLMTTIREKFKAAGKEGVLVQAEKQPTESNIATFQTELVTQMTKDEAFASAFASHLTEFMKQLGTAEVTQIMVSGIRAKSIETGDMTQKATSLGSSVKQVMGSNLEVEGDIKFGDLTQEG